MKKYAAPLMLSAFFTVSAWAEDIVSQKNGALEPVAAFSTRPGNVAASASGRVFSSMHALTNPQIQFVEIIDHKAVPYPSSSYQKNGNLASEATFDALAGLFFDKNGELWLTDMGLELGKTRIWHIDIEKNQVKEVIDLPLSVAPKGSYVQDLVVDEINGWAYMSDVANPGIIAVNLKTHEARRWSGDKTEQPENIDMVVDGKVVNFNGKPARIGMGPITISSDRETIFYGSMSGTNWYKVPAKVFRDGKVDSVVSASVERVGPHPLIDGASIDSEGNHYFTDLSNGGVSMLDKNGGELKTIVKDKRLTWLDNASVSPDDKWLYISANQLNSAPALTGGTDEGKPPYYIYRAKIK